MSTKATAKKEENELNAQLQPVGIVLQLLQDVRTLAKKIKKGADGAEKEIVKVEKQIEKTQKELKRASASRKGEAEDSAKIIKLKEYEQLLQAQRREGLEKVLSQLQEEFNTSKMTLLKLKKNIYPAAKK